MSAWLYHLSREQRVLHAFSRVLEKKCLSLDILGIAKEMPERGLPFRRQPAKNENGDTAAGSSQETQIVLKSLWSAVSKANPKRKDLFATFVLAVKSVNPEVMRRYLSPLLRKE